MADKKISALTGASTPLAGTEVLPIVQSGATVKVAVSDLTAGRATSASSYAVTGSAAPANGVYLPVANGVGIAASSAEQVRVTSGALQMRSGTALYVYNATNDGLGLWYNPGGAAVNQLVGRVNGADRLTIDGTAGDVTVGSGNLVIGTSGKGIDFSATPSTGTSELLADYEEGTWTPTLIGGTTNPTLTYGLQRAKYTKIGRLVTVSCYMSWSALSGGSGQMRLDGLPFTVSSAVPNTSDCGALMNMNGITLASGRTFAAMQAVGGTTYCVIRNLGSAVNGTTTDIPSTGASGELGFTISYVAA